MARKSTPSISNAAETFIEQRFARNRSKGVRYSYVSLLRRFASYTGDRQVGSLRPSDLEEFFYGQGGLAVTCSRNTLAKYRNDLKGFFDFCHRREWCARSGSAMVEGIPDKTTRSNRDRFRLSPSEVMLLMEQATDPRDRALLALVANTGVRISEALDLRVKDVKLSRGELYVRLIKTGSVEVTYPITSDLDPELRSWLIAYAESLGRNLEPGDRLFPAKTTGAFVDWDYETGQMSRGPQSYKPTATITNPRDIILGMAAKAGIALEPGDGWHTIRRSVARIFFDQASEAGHDAALRMTQALLHHKSSSTTEGYLGLDLEKRKVESVLKGKPFLTAHQNIENVVTLKGVERHG